MHARDILFKLRIIYDLMLHDSVVEGSHRNYVMARARSFAGGWSGRAVAAPASEKVVVRNRLGVFEVDLSNDSVYKTSPYFERRLHSWLPAGDGTFVDIGANFGLYSFLAVTKKGYARAIAFEPNPETFETLVTNVKLNAASDRITPENVAVGDSSEDLLFKAEPRETGASRVITRASVPREGLLEVRQIPLDRYCDERRVAAAEIGYCKIDIEGFEYRALRGAAETLTRMRTGARVQVEIWQGSARRADTLEFLDELGYRPLARVGNDYLFERR